MSFAQTYILASKVRAKLTKEAASPKASLRNLVTQANMLDNLMDYISEETEKRTRRDQEQREKRRVSFSEPDGHKPRVSSGLSASPSYKTSIVEYEIDSDSDDDDDDEDVADGDDDEYKDDEVHQLSGVIFDQSSSSKNYNHIPHMSSEEADDDDTESDSDSDSASSMYSSSDNDSDDYYIYSDEEDESAGDKIPRSFSIPASPSYRELPTLNVTMNSIAEEEEADAEEEEEEEIFSEAEVSDDDTITGDDLEGHMPELSRTHSLTDDDEAETLVDHEIVSPNQDSKRLVKLVSLHTRDDEPSHHNHQYYVPGLFRHDNVAIEHVY
ncbi:uncharacterized protein LODBEIA_P59880 [Lodderomyces beijingensis]|uniref:Uncharacterized protein n=1 Tax=Lodderomyces beijingensis TaxID=1775926 RepID=A0ABP0ZV05_9ASCO